MILTGHRDEVAAWVASRVRDMPPVQTTEFEAIGILKDGKLFGGVVYTSYGQLADGTHDIMMSCAGEPGWLTKASLRVFFAYPFVQLNCSRVTTIAAKGNRKARDLNERLGFTHEGTVRGGFGHGRDGILFGMLRNECRYIGKIE